MPYWLSYRIGEIARNWPLVWRKSYRRDVSLARDVGRREVTDSLEAERQTVQRLIARLADTEYRRDAGEYAITVRFSGTLFGSYADETRYIAQNVARQVEREIATSKFIKAANDHEMRRGQSMGARVKWL